MGDQFVSNWSPVYFLGVYMLKTKKLSYEEKQKIWRSIAADENAGIAARAVAIGFSNNPPIAYRLNEKDNDDSVDEEEEM